MNTFKEKVESLTKEAIFRNLVNLNKVYPTLSNNLKEDSDYYLIKLQNTNKYIVKNFEFLLKIKDYALFCKNPSILEDDLRKQRISPIMSVCIPTTLDRLNILEHCLNFWKKQKFIHPKLYEIIIVINNFSSISTKVTKNLEAFIKQSKKSNIPIYILTQEENNISKARAVTTSVAKGYFLLLVNDDTIPEEELIYKHISTQVEFHGQKVAILGKFIIDNKFIKNNYDKKFSLSGLDFPQNTVTNRTITRDKKFFTTNNLSIRKKLLFELGNFSPIFKNGAEDSDFGLRFFNSGGILIVEPNIVAKHYHNYIPNIKNIYKQRGKNNGRLAYEHSILSKLNITQLSALFNLSEILSIVRESNESLFTKGFQNLLLEEFFANLYLKIGYLEIIENLSRNKFSIKHENLPKISVVIATLNSEAFISETLNSIVGQTYKNYEIIVVDNGCTDKTMDIVKNFKKHKNIVITKENTKGQSFARNKGAKLATGEYLLFFDADDILLKYSLELFATYSLLYKSCNIIYSDFYIKTADNKLQLRKMKDISNSPLEEKILVQIGGNVFPLGATLIKKDFFFQIGGFRNSKIFAEDYDLWNRAILKNSKIAHIDIPTYIYRLHPNQYTQNTNMNQKVDNSLLSFIKEIENFYPELLSMEFLKIAILYALTRIEDVKNASKYLIKLYENLQGNQSKQEIIKSFKKLYLRRFLEKL